MSKILNARMVQSVELGCNVAERGRIFQKIMVLLSLLLPLILCEVVWQEAFLNFQEVK